MVNEGGLRLGPLRRLNISSQVSPRGPCPVSSHTAWKGSRTPVGSIRRRHRRDRSHHSRDKESCSDGKGEVPTNLSKSPVRVIVPPFSIPSPSWDLDNGSPLSLEHQDRKTKGHRETQTTLLTSLCTSGKIQTRYQSTVRDNLGVSIPIPPHLVKVPVRWGTEGTNHTVEDRDDGAGMSGLESTRRPVDAGSPSNPSSPVRKGSTVRLGPQGHCRSVSINLHHPISLHRPLDLSRKRPSSTPGPNFPRVSCPSHTNTHATETRKRPRSTYDPGKHPLRTGPKPEPEGVRHSDTPTVTGPRECQR